MLTREAGEGLGRRTVGDSGASAANAEKKVLEADLPAVTVLPRASPASNSPRNKPVSKPDKGCLLFAGVCKSPCGCGRTFCPACHLPSQGRIISGWGGAAARVTVSPFADSGKRGPFPADAPPSPAAEQLSTFPNTQRPLSFPPFRACLDLFKPFAV